MVGHLLPQGSIWRQAHEIPQAQGEHRPARLVLSEQQKLRPMGFTWFMWTTQNLNLFCLFPLIVGVTPPPFTLAQKKHIPR